MRKAAHCAVSTLMLVVALLAACSDDTTGPLPQPGAAEPAALVAAARSAPFAVSGSGIIFTATEIVLSTEPTATGSIQRSTIAGQLNGDLNGSILFNPTSVFDFVNGTLVNTGTQFFSGTVAGSQPVILHDDSFRFEIDLNTGETHGTVHFSRSGDAPHRGGWFECDLVIVGTGITAGGDLTSDYTGECVQRGNPNG